MLVPWEYLQVLLLHFEHHQDTHCFSDDKWTAYANSKVTHIDFGNTFDEPWNYDAEHKYDATLTVEVICVEKRLEFIFVANIFFVIFVSFK